MFLRGVLKKKVIFSIIFYFELSTFDETKLKVCHQHV